MSYRLLPNGDATIVRADLYSIIAIAYGLERMRLATTLPVTPRWRPLLGSIFDIDGRGGDGTAQEKIKTLLIERFGLRTHTEVCGRTPKFDRCPSMR